MNETDVMQLLKNFEALTKEVAENRKQINELLQEVGRLKAESKPVFKKVPIDLSVYDPIIVDLRP